MSRWEACWSSKIYTFQKQYPAFQEFGKRIKEVENELNKAYSIKKEMCDCCGKCGCNGSCKNRQKR